MRSTTTLTSGEIDLYGVRLRSMLEGLGTRLDSIEAATLEPSGDPDGQTEDDNVEDTAFERDSEVIATESELVGRVQDALRRIDEGTFGTCETCGQPIERERLVELPYAADCASCARLAEGGAP